MITSMQAPYLTHIMYCLLATLGVSNIILFSVLYRWYTKKKTYETILGEAFNILAHYREVLPDQVCPVDHSLARIHFILSDMGCQFRTVPMQEAERKM